MPRQLTPAQVAALTGPHRMVPTVEVGTPGTGGQVTWVPLEAGGGSVRFDADSFDRTTATLDLPLHHAPASWSSPLTPDDALVRVSYQWGDAAPLVVARLWVDDVVTRRPDGTVTVQAVSTAARISQAGFPTGDRRYTGTAVNVCQAIAAAALGVPVQTRVEGALTAGGVTVTAEQAFTGDPWMAIEDLMDASGGEAWFDADGVMVMRPQPTTKDTPDWHLAVGPGGTVTSYESRLTRGPNIVRLAVQSVAGDADVVGYAQATGALDPTGPYGPFRSDVTRPGRMTKAQADTAAAAWLTRAGGLARSVTLEAVPHPGLEVGDTVEVLFASGATERSRVLTIDLPITPGDTMTVTTKALPW